MGKYNIKVVFNEIFILRATPTTNFFKNWALRLLYAN